MKFYTTPILSFVLHVRDAWRSSLSEGFSEVLEGASIVNQLPGLLQTLTNRLHNTNK